jgi:hypothetical protein
MENDLSSIICVADMNITQTLDQCLNDMAIPEVFVQRAKQMSIAERDGFLGLRHDTILAENRALIYRMNAPSVYARGIMLRIAEATDLKMGGRGCIFSQNINCMSDSDKIFDTEKLERLCGKNDQHHEEEHALISCIVPRGSGNSLAEAVLELGLCVPVIFFGSGVGLRDRLGLLRITIPVEKEIIWFLVLRSDAELVEKTLIPRARLDVPGQGFLYKFFVQAPVTNLRIRQRKRIHAATMEQVIAAIDEVQGSSEWRRLGAKKNEDKDNSDNAVDSRGLFFIGEEDDVGEFRKTAMEYGARGATLNSVELRSYGSGSRVEAMESRSRELCDIITSREIEEKLKKHLIKTGLFSRESNCILKSFDVKLSPVIRRG